MTIADNVTALPVARTRGRLRMRSAGALLDERFPSREYVIGPWLRESESAMLWAPVGLGKSMLAITWAILVAGGGKVGGWEAPTPRPVLYVDGEMHIEDIADRVKMLMETVEGSDRERMRHNLQFIARTDQGAAVEFPDLADKRGQKEVLDRAAGIEAGLVILDNFSTLAEVADENEAAAMNPVLAMLMRFKQAKRAAILVHHSGKTGTDYRGSSKLATTFEAIIGLYRIEGRAVAEGTGFELRFGKFRGKPTQGTRNTEMTLEAGEDAEGAPKVARWAVRLASSEEMEEIIEAAESGQYRSIREIANALGMDKSKAQRLKTKAVMSGRITDAAWRAALAGSEIDEETAAF